MFIVSGAFIESSAPCTLLFNISASARILFSRKIAAPPLPVPFKVTVPAFTEVAAASVSFPIITLSINTFEALLSVTNFPVPAVIEVILFTVIFSAISTDAFT